VIGGCALLALWGYTSGVAGFQTTDRIFYWWPGSGVGTIVGLAVVSFSIPWLLGSLGFKVMIMEVVELVEKLVSIGFNRLILYLVSLIAFLLFANWFAHNVIVGVPSVLVVVLLGSLWIVSLGSYLVSLGKDMVLLKRFKMYSHLSRDQIGGLLFRLKTRRLRVRFVEMLSENRVIATGEWPEDFSLASRTDPAITQLARLEEKWLGLDR
jgi:hypothetical protein